MFTIIDSEKCFSESVSPFHIINGEFDVCQPYFRVKKEDTSINGPALKKRRKNKRKTENTQNKTDIDTRTRHELLRPNLLLCIEQLSEKWPNHWMETTVARENLPMPSDPVDFPSIQHMVETAQNKFTEREEDEEPAQFVFDSHLTKDLDIFSIFNLVCINESLEETKLLHITPEATYIIPPRSAFLMGSIDNSSGQLGSYVSSIGGADIIVMDPPWPNKSVHRSSHYETQDIYDLYSIPIKQMIASKDSIVAIWVTNKPKFRNMIINKLFPSWKLECVSEWVWLKTTTQAEPIFPIDSDHKKPYEQLIIGRPLQHNANRQTLPMPKTHIIVSIPSKRHSRKPPLQDVLSPYIDNAKDPICVELFARCLSAGWISWGNECLKFQHSSYFEKKDK